MTTHKARHNRLFKTIAAGAACLFLANQFAWAYPDALAPAGLQKEETRQQMLEAMLDWSKEEHEEEIDVPLKRKYDEHKPGGAPKFWSLEKERPGLIEGVRNLLGEIAKYDCEVAARIAQKLKGLSERGLTWNGKTAIESWINLVEEGADETLLPHPGGYGINIPYREGMTDQEITSILLHEAIAGCVFGERRRVHELATAVVETVNNGDFEGAATLFSAVISNPFPQLTEKANLNFDDFENVMRMKYVTKNLLKGGPIAQPTLLATVKMSPSLKSRVESGQLKDDRTPFEFIDPADVEEEFDDVIRNFMSGKLGSKIVFKPNRRGLAEDMIFLERKESGEIVVTMPFRMDGSGKPYRGHFDQIDTGSVKSFAINYDTYTVQFTLDERTQDVVAILHDLWTSAAVNTAQSICDSGIFEVWQTPILDRNRAYSTRHYLVGDLSTGEVDEFMLDKWVAAIGASQIVSNVRGRERGGSHFLGYDKMFDPLFQQYVPPEKTEEFKEYIKQLLGAEFKYMCKKLGAAGIVLGKKIFLKFDLIWLHPQEKEAFPAPLLIDELNPHFVTGSVNFIGEFIFAGPQPYGPLAIATTGTRIAYLTGSLQSLALGDKALWEMTDEERLEIADYRDWADAPIGSARGQDDAAGDQGENQQPDERQAKDAGAVISAFIKGGLLRRIEDEPHTLDRETVIAVLVEVCLGRMKSIDEAVRILTNPQVSTADEQIAREWIEQALLLSRAATAADRAAAPSPRRPGPKTALIVGSEASLSGRYKTLLEDKGYEVTVVDSAEGAIAHMESQPPAVVLTELHLADGLDTGERVVQTRPEGTAVVVISQSFYSDDLSFHEDQLKEERLRSLGASGVFAYAADAQVVMAAIEQAAVAAAQQRRADGRFGEKEGGSAEEIVAAAYRHPADDWTIKELRAQSGLISSVSERTNQRDAREARQRGWIEPVEGSRHRYRLTQAGRDYVASRDERIIKTYELEAAGEKGREKERIITTYSMGQWLIFGQEPIFNDEHFTKIPNSFRTKETFGVEQSDIAKKFKLGSLMPTGGDFLDRQDLIHFVYDELKTNLRVHAKNGYGYHFSMELQLVERAGRQGIRIISENEFPEIPFDKIMQGKTIRRMGLDVGGAFLLMMSCIAFSNEGIEVVFESSGYESNDYIRIISHGQDQLLTPQGRQRKPPISRISVTIFEKPESPPSAYAALPQAPKLAQGQKLSSSEEAPAEAPKGDPANLYDATEDTYLDIEYIAGRAGVAISTAAKDLRLLYLAGVLDRWEITRNKRKMYKYRRAQNLQRLRGWKMQGLISGFLNDIFNRDNPKNRGNVTRYREGEEKEALIAALRENFVVHKKMHREQGDETPAVLSIYEKDARTTGEIISEVKNLRDKYGEAVAHKYILTINEGKTNAYQRAAVRNMASSIAEKMGAEIGFARADDRDEPTFIFECRDADGNTIGKAKVEEYASAISLDRTVAILNLGLGASSVPHWLNEESIEGYMPLLKCVNDQYRRIDVLGRDLIRFLDMPSAEMSLGQIDEIVTILHDHTISAILPAVEKVDFNTPDEKRLQYEALGEYA